MRLLKTSEDLLFEADEIEVRTPECTDSRGTPIELFSAIARRYALDGEFDLDVCASRWNAKCQHYYIEEDDALCRTWNGACAWCNPPYSDIYPWLAHGLAELEAEHVERIVYLLPIRGYARWWHDFKRHMAFTLDLPFRVAFDYPPGEAKKHQPYESSTIWVAERPLRRSR